MNEKKLPRNRGLLLFLFKYLFDISNSHLNFRGRVLFCYHECKVFCKIFFYISHTILPLEATCSFFECFIEENLVLILLCLVHELVPEMMTEFVISIELCELISLANVDTVESFEIYSTCIVSTFEICLWNEKSQR